MDVYNIEKLKELEQVLVQSDRIVLVGHVHPDGDSIGSLVGMREFLKAHGKTVTAMVPDRFPDFLRFLDPECAILEYTEQPESVEAAVAEAQLVICMDFNALGRIDSLGRVIETAAARKALIDHHPQPSGIFSPSFSYPELSSACELTFWLIRGLQKSGVFGKELPLASAIALYTGMMTDTNNFSNSVVPSTFKMAAELMDMGIDKEWIQTMVFGGYSEDRMRLMGYMLSENMKVIPEYGAAVMVLTKEIKDRFHFQDGDSEGFVNLALNIRKVKVSALFTEGDEFLRVSLRSKGDFSVNRLSRASFNGGGHERAAGGRLYLPVGEVEDYFVKALKDFAEAEKKA